MNFNNKNGQLNSYALSCGYVQSDSVRTVDKQIDLKLYMKHSAYHVKCTVWDVIEPHEGCIGVETDLSNPSTNWRIYDNLTDARKTYNRMRKAMLSIEYNFKILM